VLSLTDGSLHIGQNIPDLEVKLYEVLTAMPDNRIHTLQQHQYPSAGLFWLGG
jgi:hypothetical protein